MKKRNQIWVRNKIIVNKEEKKEKLWNNMKWIKVVIEIKNQYQKRMAERRKL